MNLIESLSHQEHRNTTQFTTPETRDLLPTISKPLLLTLYEHEPLTTYEPHPFYLQYMMISFGEISSFVGGGGGDLIKFGKNCMQT